MGGQRRVCFAQFRVSYNLSKILFLFESTHLSIIVLVRFRMQLLKTYESLRTTGVWHQCHADLCDDAEVGLSEDPATVN
jgi:hypothetical protein